MIWNGYCFCVSFFVKMALYSSISYNARSAVSVINYEQHSDDAGTQCCRSTMLPQSSRKPTGSRSCSKNIVSFVTKSSSAICRHCCRFIISFLFLQGLSIARFEWRWQDHRKPTGQTVHSSITDVLQTFCWMPLMGLDSVTDNWIIHSVMSWFMPNTGYLMLTAAIWSCSCLQI